MIEADPMITAATTERKVRAHAGMFTSTRQPGKRSSPHRAKAAEIVALYAQGYGHKAIGKKVGAPERITLVILKEAGVYKPGRLQGGKMHRKLISEAGRGEVDPIKEVIKKREEGRYLRKGLNELPLFCAQHTQEAKRKESNQRQSRRQLERYHSSPEYRLRVNLKNKLNKLITGWSRANSALGFLGISLEAFKAHIERQWLPGMSWDNHGSGSVNVWHLDHIRPCASFDLTNPAEQAICFHYTNFRPMWGRDNIAKGSNWNGKRHRYNEKRGANA